MPWLVFAEAVGMKFWHLTTLFKKRTQGTEKIRESAMGVMEHLNWGYIQLGLVALVFGGLQVW